VKLKLQEQTEGVVVGSPPALPAPLGDAEQTVPISPEPSPMRSKYDAFDASTTTCLRTNAPLLVPFVGEPAWIVFPLVKEPDGVKLLVQLTSAMDMNIAKNAKAIAILLELVRLVWAVIFPTSTAYAPPNSRNSAIYMQKWLIAF
jgi:hypothetical protein